MHIPDYIHDDEKCRDILISIFLDNVIACTFCGSSNFYTYKSRKIYKCKNCEKQFSFTSILLFKKTKIPMNRWLLALIFYSINNPNSYQLSRLIDVSQKSCWLMIKKIDKLTNPIITSKVKQMFTSK